MNFSSIKLKNKEDKINKGEHRSKKAEPQHFTTGNT